MYSLLRPSDVRKVAIECQPHFDTRPNQGMNNQPTPLQLPEPIPQMLPIQPLQQIPPALLMQPEFSIPEAPIITEEITGNQLVPYESHFNENVMPELNPNQEGFSFLHMLENDDDDEMLLMAATQHEKTSNDINTIEKTTSTKVLKKWSPRLSLETTFVGCPIGSIETVNIHIHKH